MTTRLHPYSARIIWEGNAGGGTADYTSYRRRYRAVVTGKPDLLGTADPMFRGESDKHNPEEFLLLAVSACHMLFYLSLCARRGVRVLSYTDDASGTVRVDSSGGGAFEEITLHPRVSIDTESDATLAVQLHDAAHELCFIANSCRFGIRHEPVVQPG